MLAKLADVFKKYLAVTSAGKNVPTSNWRQCSNFFKFRISVASVSILSSPMSSVRLCWSCYCNNGNNGCQAIEWLIAAATHRYHLEMALVTCYSLHWQAGGDTDKQGRIFCLRLQFNEKEPKVKLKLANIWRKWNYDNKLWVPRLPPRHRPRCELLHCSKNVAAYAGSKTSLKDKLVEDILN